MRVMYIAQWELYTLPNETCVHFPMKVMYIAQWVMKESYVHCPIRVVYIAQ